MIGKEGKKMTNKLIRKYGLFTAICMVVGIVIGSGVFFKAQAILTKTGGDMPLAIAAWLIGGAIMLVCLLTFSFMGQKYERVNGLVDYAEATVGPRYGYYMGWFSATVYFPGMTSVLAWVSARYTMEFLTAANPDFPMAIPVEQGGCVIGPECMALTLFYLCAVYAMNVLSPKLAGKFQTSTTLIKMIPLALMAVVGLYLGPIGALFALVLACVIGLLFHALRRGDGARPFPFGPSIAVAAAGMLLFGAPLVAWYRGLLV